MQSGLTTSFSADLQSNNVNSLKVWVVVVIIITILETGRESSLKISAPITPHGMYFLSIPIRSSSFPLLSERTWWDEDVWRGRVKVETNPGLPGRMAVKRCVNNTLLMVSWTTVVIGLWRKHHLCFKLIIIIICSHTTASSSTVNDYKSKLWRFDYDNN